MKIEEGLTARQKIMDYIRNPEFITNLFIIYQSEENLRKNKIKGAKTSVRVCLLKF